MDQEQVNLIDDLIMGVSTPDDKSDDSTTTDDKSDNSATNDDTSVDNTTDDTTGDTTDDTTGDTTDDTNSKPPVLDYTIKVPLASGEDITLGQMKDYYQDAKRNELQRIEAINETNLRLEEVRALSAHFDVLPPHVKQQLQVQQQAHTRDEFNRLLEVIPAWTTAASFNAGKDAVYALAESYGLKDDVSKVVDHRVIKLLHDFSVLRDSIKRAKESVQPIRSKTPPGKPHKQPSNQDKQDQLVTRAKQSNSMSDKLSAIDSLIS